MPPITWVGMTRQRYSLGRALGPPRLLVVHATAGGDSLAYLRRGGDDRPVSAHLHIDKAGHISQLVAYGDTAWHCGESAWRIDGRAVGGSSRGTARLNWYGIGVELENRNDGVDPYPDAQIYSLLSVARDLVARYAIPPAQVVRHLDIAPSRKHDPAGFPWQWFKAALTAVRSARVASPANVRQGPGRAFPVAATMRAGDTLVYDAVTTGERIGDDARWLHRADGVGFVHMSLVEGA